MVAFDWSIFDLSVYRIKIDKKRSQGERDGVFDGPFFTGAFGRRRKFARLFFRALSGAVGVKGYML